MVHIHQCAYTPSHSPQSDKLTAHSLSLINLGGKYAVLPHITTISQKIFGDTQPTLQKIRLTQKEITIYALNHDQKEEVYKIYNHDHQWTVYDPSNTSSSKTLELSDEVVQVLKKVRSAWGEKEKALTSYAPPSSLTNRSSHLETNVSESHQQSHLNVVSHLSHNHNSVGMASHQSMATTHDLQSNFLQPPIKPLGKAADIPSEDNLDEIEFNFSATTLSTSAATAHDSKISSLEKKYTQLDNQVAQLSQTVEALANQMLSVLKDNHSIQSRLQKHTVDHQELLQEIQHLANNTLHAHEAISNSQTPVRDPEDEQLNLLEEHTLESLQELLIMFKGDEELSLLEKQETFLEDPQENLNPLDHLENHQSHIQEVTQEPSVPPSSPLLKEALGNKIASDKKSLSPHETFKDLSLADLQLVSHGISHAQASFTEVAKNHFSLHPQIVGPLLFNLAWIDSSSFLKSRSLKQWIQSKITTRISDKDLERYEKSIKAHTSDIKNIAESAAAKKARINKINAQEPLRNSIELTKILNGNKKLIDKISHFKADSEDISPQNIFKNHIKLGYELQKFNQNIAPLIDYYRKMTDRQRASLTPEATYRFEYAQNLSNLLRQFVKSLQTTLNRSDWKIK